MSALHWNATVDDTPDSDPYAVLGDLVLAVRTPRSRDFVTVEVGSAAWLRQRREAAGHVFKSSEPYPCFRREWQGEVHTGRTVHFLVAGQLYHLTLRELAESPAGFPWVSCLFSLEQA